jgi:hypothetical protein
MNSSKAMDGLRYEHEEKWIGEITPTFESLWVQWV